MNRSQEHANSEAGGGVPRPQVEQRLLGSLIMWPEGLPTVCEGLTAAHFASATNRRIYCALVSMHSTEEPIDLVTMRDELLQEGDLRDAETSEYLVGLAEQADQAFESAVGTEGPYGPAGLRSDMIAEMQRYARLLRELGPAAD